ncbi:LOW QUALITY PROTEIN: C-C motif chemokine 24 [Glossophaga mutica]
MTGPMTVVADLLLLALCSVVISSSCCMAFISKKTENRVVNYLSNRSICPQGESEVTNYFATKRGQKFRGDPEKPWVQRYMKNLNAKWKRHPANSSM